MNTRKLAAGVVGAIIVIVILVIAANAFGQEQRATPAQRSAVHSDNMTRMAGEALDLKIVVAQLEAQFIALDRKHQAIVGAAQAVVDGHGEGDPIDEALATLAALVAPPTESL